MCHPRTKVSILQRILGAPWTRRSFLRPRACRRCLASLLPILSRGLRTPSALTLRLVNAAWPSDRGSNVTSSEKPPGIPQKPSFPTPTASKHSALQLAITLTRYSFYEFVPICASLLFSKFRKGGDCTSSHHFIISPEPPPPPPTVSLTHRD